MAFGAEYSVGVNAPAFPRDPLNVNMYLEHVLVGQALEPLFVLGDDGQIKGGIAEKWEFSDDQKTLTVSIRPHLIFSNGRVLTADDVKYSLDRHVTNPASQSYNYLKVIKSIEIIDPLNIRIRLNYKYVPILLSLSRDQLGILPKGWTFDPISNEPFIGTGPYRIVREASNWFLIQNKSYRNMSDIKIQRWKIDILDPAQNKFPDKPSDLFFLIPKPLNDLFKIKYQQYISTYEVSRSFSFAQYSFWWLGEHFNSFSENEKMQIRDALEELSFAMVSAYGGLLSTGIIPPGIQGSLDERPHFVKSARRRTMHLRISAPQAIADLMNNEIKAQTKIRESNVNIVAVPHDISQDLSKEMAASCHTILISYAGGFFDPEGYLSVLPKMLDKTSLDLFGKKAEIIRLKAQSETSGIKRAELYREFSRITQKDVRYIPGWIPTFSDIRNPKLVKRSSAFKYSYKLIDYQEKGKEEK
jgi:ABC-type transport system substrate-binding protein